MKRIVIALLMMLPLAATAQSNAWEQTETTITDPKMNPKYLAGAVPEVDGRVVFETTINAPGKTKAQLYDAVVKLMRDLVQGPEQVKEQSRVAIEDAEKGQVVASLQEWLVFKSTALVLDRTRLLYHFIADCEDGRVRLQMTRIIYIYDEEREAQTYKAEEWINDKYGLNKKQTKLARVSGKFRQKTIDRKDYLFRKFSEALTK